MIHSILNLFPKNIQDQYYTYRLGRALVKDERSYLVTTGYVDSKIKKELKDDKGQVVPWMNYPTIAFLQEKMKKNLKVLEYGSGASTVFFAKKADSVESIEYNKEWYSKVENLLQEEELKNVQLHYATVEDGYSEIHELVGNDKKFDVVVIDGRKRVETAKNCYEVLSEDGVVILDDSGRERYQEVFDFYLEKGFSKLTFEGIKPGGFRKDNTTIFYRRNKNCFDI